MAKAIFLTRRQYLSYKKVLAKADFFSLEDNSLSNRKVLAKAIFPNGKQEFSTERS